MSLGRVYLWHRAIPVSVFAVLLVGMYSLALEENLLKNASFVEVDSKGYPNGWAGSYGGLKEGESKPSGFLKTVSGGKSGKREAQLHKPDSIDWVYAQQVIDLPLTAGEEYVFSVWMRSDGSVSVDLAFAAMPSEDGVKHQWVRQRKDITDSWQQYQITLKVNADAEYIKLRCVLQLYTSDVALSIDDAAVVHKGN